MKSEPRADSWRRLPIGEVCIGIFDGPHATPKPSEDGPVFLGIANITEYGRLELSDNRHISEEDFPAWVRRVRPGPGDIVFTYEATLNRYALIPSGLRCCLGRRLALIRPDPSKADARFLFYSFFGPDWRRTIAENTVLGSTVDRIPINRFGSFPIRVPPLSTQRKIAAVLSAYDDLIENNLRRIAILEEMAQSLYREWFVHFRFPGHERVRMVASTLGPVPQGWVVRRLGEVAVEVRRSVEPDSLDPDTPYVGLEHIPRRSFALAEWGKARDAASTKFRFSTREILFGKIRPYFHKVAVAPVDGICSSDAIVIRAREAQFFPLILGSVFSEEFVDHATQTSQGTKMPRANWGVLTEYPVVIPPDRLLSRFNDTIEAMVDQVLALVARNRNLRHTRDLLLPRLVSGEVGVEGLP